MIVTEKGSRSGSRFLAYLFGFIALTGVIQVAVMLPRWDEGRARMSIVLAVLLIVMGTVLAVRFWGGGGDPNSSESND